MQEKKSGKANKDFDFLFYFIFCLFVWREENPPLFCRLHIYYIVNTYIYIHIYLLYIYIKTKLKAVKIFDMESIVKNILFLSFCEIL